MIERVRRVVKSERKRKPKNSWAFSDLTIKGLKRPKQGQELHWDKGQHGLSLLVGRRTKTFRSQFKLNGAWVTRTLGRFGAVDVEGGENANVAWARELTRQDRIMAGKGIDPRVPPEGQQAASKLTFGYVVDQFIEHDAKPRQHTWDQTERILKNNCAQWLGTPIADIPHDDIRKLLRKFIADGHPSKAAITRAWLKRLWRWAHDEDHVPTPIIKGINNIHIAKKQRDRVYSDAEIKAVWLAANQLDTVEGVYVKLMVLLAPRKTALASMRRVDLKDDPDKPTLWVTPHESTKSQKKLSETKKRVYLTPLPRFVQNVIEVLPKGKNGSDRLFPGFPVHDTRAGRPVLHGRGLTRKLVEHGAPKDVQFHAWRHTISTWLENKGHSEWEVGLVLNHSGSGSVTSNYMHGYALDLKRTLLDEWAAHVESVVIGKAKSAGRSKRNVVVPLRPTRAEAATA